MQLSLYRAEGRLDLAAPRDGLTLSHADQIVRGWARTAPRDGSYHKVDVRVDLPNWQVYFRLDMTHRHAVGTPVRDELLSECRFRTGACPSHMTEAEYQTVLLILDRNGTRRPLYREILREIESDILREIAHQIG